MLAPTATGTTPSKVSHPEQRVLKTSLSPDAADPDPSSWAPAFGSDLVSLDTRRQHTTTDVQTSSSISWCRRSECGDSVPLAAAWGNSAGDEVKLYMPCSICKSVVSLNNKKQ